MRAHIRVRTYVEQDDKGWWCVCGLWSAAEEENVGTPGDEPLRPPRCTLRIGPWESEGRAWKELRGKFRESVTKAVEEMMKEHDASITAAEWTS